MRNNQGIFERIDWVTVSLYLLLVFVGWLNIYAAVYNEEHQSIFDISQRYGKQLLWIGAAIVIAIAVLLVDFRFYSSFGYVLYAIMMALLLAVLIFGTEVKGARSWFTFGSVAIQPSEFAKFATGLALAKYLSGLNVKVQNSKTRFISFVIIFLPAVLILFQPDTGSTLVYASLLVVMYREGLSGKYFTLAISVALLFIFTLLIRNSSIGLSGEYSLDGGWILVTMLAILGIFVSIVFRKIKYVWQFVVIVFVLASCVILSVDYVFDNVLQAHQTKRIDVLLGLEDDPKGAGYNVNQSMIAIGSGGFAGKGYLQGTQTKYDFVPEQSTDFIFCTIGEEWGFLGSLVLITLFVFLFLRLIQLAERQRSPFSRIYGYAVASILFFHFAVNIGMTIGLAPVIGIPLPFISYGGSSLWSFTVLLFIFVKLDSDRLNIL
ncbi:MAG: rod shape-determining protein RodA [Vicingaceae bacterium]